MARGADGLRGARPSAPASSARWLPGVFSLSGGTFVRRRRRRHAEDVLEDPLAAPHRRGARGVRRHRQDAALAEQPAPLAVFRQRHPSEIDRRRRWRCRSAWRAARSGTCSRRRAASRTLRFSWTMLSKNSSVSRRNAWRRLSSKSGNSRRFGHRGREVAQVQPLARRSWSSATSARGSASIRVIWASSTAGSRSRPRSAAASSCVVGNAAPEEERQARRQLHVADPIRTRRCERRRDRARCGTGTPGSSESPAAPSRCRPRNRPRRVARLA